MYDLPDAPWVRDAEMNGVPESKVFKCPECGSENPRHFFTQGGEILGCSDCIDVEDAETVAYAHPWLFDGGIDF